MFNYETEHIIRKIQKSVLGKEDTVSLRAILSAPIHNAIKVYFRASLYNRQTSGKRLRTDDTSDIQKIKTQVDLLLPSNYVFDQDTFTSLLTDAVHFIFNYLCRPRWTMKEFFFQMTQTVGVSDLKQGFLYFSAYDYYPTLLLRYLHKNNMTTIDKDTFDELTLRIDSIVLKDSTADDYIKLLEPLADFVNYGRDEENPAIPEHALALFFGDKGLTTLRYAFESAVKKRNIEELTLESLRDLLESISEEELTVEETGAPVETESYTPPVFVPKQTPEQTDEPTEAEVDSELDRPLDEVEPALDEEHDEESRIDLEAEEEQPVGIPEQTVEGPVEEPIEEVIEEPAGEPAEPENPEETPAEEPVLPEEPEEEIGDEDIREEVIDEEDIREEVIDEEELEEERIEESESVGEEMPEEEEIPEEEEFTDEQISDEIEEPVETPVEEEPVIEEEHEEVAPEEEIEEPSIDEEPAEKEPQDESGIEEPLPAEELIGEDEIVHEEEEIPDEDEILEEHMIVEETVDESEEEVVAGEDYETEEAETDTEPEPDEEMTEEEYEEPVGETTVPDEEEEVELTKKEKRDRAAMPNLDLLIEDDERRRFIRKLFNGDAAYFSVVVQTLNKMTSWKEASLYIDEIFLMNGVDPYSTDSVNFTDKVYGRFSQKSKFK
jgi:hypothetical protein